MGRRARPGSNVPASEKGQGKIRRKAKPGGWREDLTEEQIVAIENATSRYLDEVYPDRPRFSPAEKP